MPKQKVRVRIDVTLEIDAKHSRSRIREIVDRGSRSLYRNNAREFHSVTYRKHGDVSWEVVLSDTEVPKFPA